MVNDFYDLIENATLETRNSTKSGKPYHMLVLDLGRDIKLEFICLNGEQNVIRVLLETPKKA